MVTFDEACAQLREMVGDVWSDDPQASKRRRIVRAGTELFVQHGYRKTSVSEVAERAGVAKGTVYLYYKTKTDIFFAAVAMEKLDYLAAFSTAFDGSAPPRQRLRNLLYEGLLVGTRAPLTARLIGGDAELAAVMADAPRELVEQSRSQSDELFGELLAASIAPAQFDATTLRARAQALGATPLVGPILQTMAKHTNTTASALAHALTDILLDGIAATPTPPPSST